MRRLKGSQKHVTKMLKNAEKIPDPVVTWSPATCSIGLYFHILIFPHSNISTFYILISTFILIFSQNINAETQFSLMRSEKENLQSNSEDINGEILQLKSNEHLQIYLLMQENQSENQLTKLDVKRHERRKM